MKIEIGINDVREALAKGDRVLLMTRHAERPHIDPEDPTFGESLPITKDGERMAFDFGASLRGASDDVQILSSPLHRTRLTAVQIARGMGLEERWNYDTIPTDDIIGNGSYYYADAYAVWKIFRGGEFYRLSFEYCHNGVQTGFRPLDVATDMLEEHVMAKFNAKLGIFTSHDLFIASFLSGRNAYSGWTVETWVQFLDSAAIIISPDGSRRYALVRRNR